MQLSQRKSRDPRHLIQEADGQQTQVGVILRNETRFDGVAKTTGYAPERSRSDFETIEEASAFVEAFKPLEGVRCARFALGRACDPTAPGASTPQPGVEVPAVTSHYPSSFSTTSPFTSHERPNAMIPSVSSTNTGRSAR